MSLYRTAERPAQGKISQSAFQKDIARYRFAADLINQKHVLDVGCGVGMGTYLMFDRGRPKDALGVDISQEAVSYAQSHYARPGLDFKIMNAMNLEFDNGVFDVVTAFELIEHLSDFRSFLKGVHRILKTDGIFVVSTPNKLMTSPGLKHPLHRPHIHEFYYNEFGSLIEEWFIIKSVHGQHRVPVRKGLARIWYILKTWTQAAIYPFVPTILIKLYKDLYYPKKQELQEDIIDRFKVKRVVSSKDFLEGDSVYSVMLAICCKR